MANCLNTNVRNIEQKKLSEYAIFMRVAISLPSMRSPPIDGNHGSRGPSCHDICRAIAKIHHQGKHSWYLAMLSHGNLINVVPQ